MNRHRTYAERDEVPSNDGDLFWRGVEMRAKPDQLADGWASYAENVRFDDGAAATRRGIVKVPWAAPTVGYTYSTPFVQPFDNVIAAETWNDPETAESWLVIICRDPVTYQMSAWKAQPSISGRLIPSPAGETIPERVKLIQTYDGLVMLRGENLDPLYMSDAINGFKVVPEAATPNNTKIPPSTVGIYFQNRLFVVDARPQIAYRDTVWVSDFGATDSVLEGNGTWNNFKINVGSRDRLVAVFKFNDTTLIAAKSASIYAVSNIVGTNTEIQTYAVLDAITTEYGCIAANSFVQVGADVWFLAHKRGICSIRQTETNALQGVDVPVSRSIQPLIDRINWEHATDAQAAFVDNKVYFAVPLDDSTYNNAVLVYDTRNAAWCGVDTSDAIRVKDWIRYEYAGVERLHFLSDDGFLNMYEADFYDHVADGADIAYESINTVFRTRGYHGRASGVKRFTRVQASLRTWWPKYTVKLLTPGVGETSTIKDDVTKSRVKYTRPHDAEDFDPTNINDDHATPHREDYSVLVDDDGLNFGSNGVALDYHQEFDCDWAIKERGEHAVVEITNDQGRIEISKVSVDAQRGGVRHRDKA